MRISDVIAIVLTLSAVFGYLSHRYVRLPTNVGLMLVALLFSLVLIGLDRLGLRLADDARLLLRGVDFSAAFLHGILGFLLFAGALRIDLNDLLEHKWVVTVLATLGTALSTFLIGVASFIILDVAGLHVPLILCFLFGALISPTDPVAVLAILKDVRAPKAVATQIQGESLFNDGVSVAIFLLLLAVADGRAPTGADIVAMFFQEVVGGMAFGLAAGAVTSWFLKRMEDYVLELLMTLALVSGGYALADHLGVSAPMAMVVAGLLIGNRGRRLAMSAETRRHIDLFWQFVDEIMNAVLFVLVGLEVLTMTFRPEYLPAMALLVPVVLVARLVSVGLPVTVLRSTHPFPPFAVTIMTWGGLRGGISVAMALSLPPGESRAALLAITYGIVVFSTLVQATTIERLVRISNF
jgi:CPA1 family monovalent cation:H+ antiporter